jgi:hypothetical protein
MKASGFRTIVIRSVLLILLSLYFLIVFGQNSPNLVSFNANRKANNVSLQWQLAAANNVSTVVIEKKNAGNEFKSVAEFWVNFEGNNTTNFHFTDKAVNKSKGQYRLKLVSNKGDVEYSGLISEKATSSIKSSGKNSLTAVNKIQTATQTHDLRFLLRLHLQERESNFL